MIDRKVSSVFGTVLTAMALGLVAAPARATLVPFSFDINEPSQVEHVVGQFDVDLSTLITDPDTNFSGYLITSLTGTQDGNVIELLGPGTFGPFNLNNNLLGLGGSPLLDIKGFAYKETDTGEIYQTFYDNGYKGCPESCDTPFTPFTVTNFNVPEPASLALFSLGLAGLGFSRRSMGI